MKKVQARAKPASRGKGRVRSLSLKINIKMESIRKLSNFNFQWTKTLYQNNLNNTAFFLHFLKAIDITYYL